MDSLIYVTSNGSQFTWVVQAVNNGPGIATNVLIENTIPQGVSISSFSASKGERVQGTDNWALSNLKSKEVFTLTLNMQVDDIALAPFDLLSYISADQLDKYQLNNELAAQVIDTCRILEECTNSDITNMRIAEPQSSDFKAQIEHSYPVDTTSSSVKINMPATSATGDRIEIWDYLGNATTNNITLNFNGNHLNNNGLIITGIFDGVESPKAIELLVTDDIADMTQYGLGVGSNGTGSPGVEFTFPAGSASNGTFIYVTNSLADFNSYFGFSANYQDPSIDFDGNDSVEVFKDGSLIDIYGDPLVNGIGNVWEYTDSWAYRDYQTPSLTVGFNPSEWTFMAPSENIGESTNDLASNPFPHGSYVASKISGSPENEMVIDMDNANLLFTYQGDAIGWKYIATNLTNLFV